MTRRILTTLAVAALAVAVLVPAASADPSNAKNSLTFPANCEGTPVQFVVNGQGAFTPAHVADSTSKFIPQAFDIEFTFTPLEGPVFSEHDTSAHANPHGKLVTCSVDFTQEIPDEGTLHFEGTVTGFFTPANKK